MIGTWNYPLFLNAPPIAQALAAGNAVVWKASELAPLCGAKLEESLKRGRVPRGTGRGRPGRAGSRPGARRIRPGQGDVHRRRRERPAGAGRPGPAGGSPPWRSCRASTRPIVLADAPRASTVRALTWAAFVGCGQTCVGGEARLRGRRPRPVGRGPRRRPPERCESATRHRPASTSGR